MPLVTIASAISLMSFSLTLQPNLFQLFQPIGGVFARPLSCAQTLLAQEVNRRTTSIREFFIDAYPENPVNRVNPVTGFAGFYMIDRTFLSLISAEDITGPRHRPPVFCTTSTRILKIL